MDTLQLKMMVMGTLADMKFISSQDEMMEVANKMYEWLMEEVKLKEEAKEPIQLSMFKNEEPLQ